MKFGFLPIALMLASLPLSAAAVESGPVKFTVSQETMIPGTSLQPGAYSIRVIDHLQDRMILRVEGEAGGEHTLFLGIPATGLKGSGAVSYESAPGGKAALRGFVFGTGNAVEFVYPKNDAVALAKLNGKKVVAVDPGSEGKPEQMGNLTKDQMQMVTLWMLTPETVGGESKIAAAKYKQQVASVASNHPAISPAMKSLPHTASFFPLILLIGFVSALLAGLLAMRRLAVQSSN